MPVLGTTAFPQASEVFSLVRSMLNDADVPSNIPIGPTGASRTGTITTITTTVAHGLQIGNIVQVQSVSLSSFNGTQTVLAVPTATTFTYVQPGLPNATSGNGVVSIVIQGDVFTDQVLLNFANKAYRKVQARLMQAGSRSQTTEVEFLNVPQGTLSITDSTDPQLPVDFLAPRLLWDRITGTQFYNQNPMTPVDFVPNVAQGSTNRVYAWYEDGIYFLGALNATDIRMRYSVAFPDVSGGDGFFTIRGCEDCIASKTAQLAAASRGSQAAGQFEQQFEQDIQELLNVQAHARQYQPSRRRPSNRRRNAYTGFGF
jgi:hypothetical protein